MGKMHSSLHYFLSNLMSPSVKFSHPNFVLNSNYYANKMCVAAAMACCCDEVLNINYKYYIVLLEIFEGKNFADNTLLNF